MSETENASPPFGCLCSALAYEAWEDSTVSFDGRPFLRRRIPLFLRQPIGLAEELRAIGERAVALKLDRSLPHMVLQPDRGIFRGELLLALDESPGLPDEVVRIRGTYRTAVHRGSHALVGRTARRYLRGLRRELGIRPGEVFFWYANCPVCWHGRGGAVTIILARIGNPVLESKTDSTGS